MEGGIGMLEAGVVAVDVNRLCRRTKGCWTISVEAVKRVGERLEVLAVGLRGLQRLNPRRGEGERAAASRRGWLWGC